MTKIEKKLNRIIEKKPFELGKFIQKETNHFFFSKLHQQEIIKLLPVIIEHTKDDNGRWIKQIPPILLNNPKFIDIFLNNLDKIDFSNDDYLMVTILDSIFMITNLNSNQLEKLGDKLLECNIQNYSHILNLLATIFEMNQNTPKLLETTLKKYLFQEKTCDATIQYLLVEEKFTHLIEENIDLILNSKKIDLFQLKKNYSQNQKIINKIKTKIEENKNKSIQLTIYNLYYRFLMANNQESLDKSSKKNLNTILEIISLIIEDICKNEQVNISDLDILNSGAFSSVLAIGDKVIKIGCKRGTKTYPNNPYVNSMILRKEFLLDDNTSFFIEVSEKVDTLSEVSTEELYQLYKKVRELHLIWTDVAQRNVGRLLKDNQVYWHQELPLTDERLNLKSYRGDEMLKKGELVILDNDFIYDENENPLFIKKYSTTLQENFEKRYQLEKKYSSYKSQKEQENIEVNHPKTTSPRKK